MKQLLFALIAIAPLATSQGKQTFTGMITDSMCANGNHSSMQMGPTDGECTIACVRAHGATYVLFDGKEVYTFSDQAAPEKFAGQRVRVTGMLDAKTKTIRMESIAAAK